MSNVKSTPATRLALTLLKASIIYELGQVAYEVEVNDNGSHNSGRLIIYSTDSTQGSLHSLYSLVTMFGEGVFSQYVQYNSYKDRCELVVYSYRLDEPKESKA